MSKLLFFVTVSAIFSIKSVQAFDVNLNEILSNKSTDNFDYKFIHNPYCNNEESLQSSMKLTFVVKTREDNLKRRMAIRETWGFENQLWPDVSLRTIFNVGAEVIKVDLGAEVIKVERPGMGDESRRWGPPFMKNSEDSVYSMACNRNKKSICIDMKNGVDIIHELAKKSDVLVENYVPGKLDTMKLGYEDMKKIAPHLIYCSVTGYGSVGPYAKRPGYDVIASSMGGLLHITGQPDGPPSKVGVAVTDVATGLYAHGAILAALYQRHKTGRGQKIDVNLLSTQVSLLINVASNYLNAGLEAKRMGTAHGSIVPYQAFQTKSGYLTIGAGSDDQFKSLCKILNVSDLAANEKFITNKDRVKNRVELIGILSEILQKKTNSEWMEVFAEAPFAVGPVNSMKEVFNDVHIKDIGLVKTLEHPESGEVKVVGPPVVYSEARNDARTAPPTLGQHTDEVLRDVLGYDSDYIKNLRSKKLVA